MTPNCMKRNLLVIELELLISLLDEHLRLFCQRIEFIRDGCPNKARFIDEHILPTVDKKISGQTERVRVFLSRSE